MILASREEPRILLVLINSICLSIGSLMLKTLSHFSSNIESEYNSEESLLLNIVSSLYLSDQASSAVKEIIGDSSKESSLNIIEIED